MRIHASLSLFAALAFTGCFPTPRPPVAPSARNPSGAASVAAASGSSAAVPHPAEVKDSPVVAMPPAEVPVSPPRLVDSRVSGISFQGVAFDSRSHRLIVADQAGGPGSRFADARSAADANGGLAATNAGFFTPEGSPLGLVVSRGAVSGAWNSASSLGSGVWHETAAGGLSILRRESLGRAGAAASQELIQAGPMLVDRGKPTGGLEAVKQSARTVVLWDGGTRWWLGCTSSCTLAELASALGQEAGPAGWKPASGLNLDGGRSSDLWVSSKVRGGPLTRRPIWNKAVRNFLILVPR